MFAGAWIYNALQLSWLCKCKTILTMVGGHVVFMYSFFFLVNSIGFFVPEVTANFTNKLDCSEFAFVQSKPTPHKSRLFCYLTLLQMHWFRFPLKLPRFASIFPVKLSTTTIRNVLITGYEALLWIGNCSFEQQDIFSRCDFSEVSAIFCVGRVCVWVCRFSIRNERGKILLIENCKQWNWVTTMTKSRRIRYWNTLVWGGKHQMDANCSHRIQCAFQCVHVNLIWRRCQMLASSVVNNFFLSRPFWLLLLLFVTLLKSV